ncbi:hypothetical protein ACFE04_011523 [Oxalis oulophora]
MENKTEVPDLISSILPTDDDESIADATNVDNLFKQSMTNLQWFIFKGNPADALAKMDVGQRRRVCGVVLDSDDMSFGCTTCGLDLNFVTCYHCFRDRNHEEYHDVSVFYTTTSIGYCCCGDVDVWRREGFCSNHGDEQIQPLEEKLVKSMGLALISLFKCWKDKLSNDLSAESGNYTNGLTIAIVEMLLNFCERSERLQSFIVAKVISSAGLLEILIKCERFLRKNVVNKLHVLLMKLLVERSFKHEFSKEFLKYYPVAVKHAIEYNKNGFLETYPLLSTFSKKIFSIHTPRLVKEQNLLATLFACLQYIFVASAEDGCLKEMKWKNFYDVTFRVVQDIQLVIKHATVAQYMIHERRDLSRTWLRLLSFMQGMCPLKRETEIHVPEVYDNLDRPLDVVQCIASINSLLVSVAFDVSSTNKKGDNIDNLRASERLGGLQVTESVTWLTHECLRSIEEFLRSDDGKVGKVEGNHGYLSLSEWPDILYEVSSQEISIHFPLHRFLSLLLQKVLSDFVVNIDDLFGHLLRGCHRDGFSAFIMEHPLRIRVFCAQFRAGMWGENDVTALVSLEYYLNAHLSEGLELDIFLLQLCAAFSSADVYVERIVRRFGLSEYLPLNLEKSNEYESALVTEMLTLIIQILQERRFCGLTISQILKKELIYKLAIEDTNFWKLVKAVPRDLSQIDQLKEFFDATVIFTGPSAFKDMFPVVLESL